jgi:hypothetical protein
MKRMVAVDQHASLVNTPRNLPPTRGHCRGVQRPCPYVSCRYHLELEVTVAGNLKFVHPVPDEDGGVSCEPQGETCALDVAEDGGGIGLEEIADLLGLTGERARQIESEALVKLARSPLLQEVAGVRGDPNVPKRHAEVAALAKLNRRVRIPRIVDEDFDD